MTCTPDCQAAHQKYIEAVRAYESVYPDYCTSCNGYGAVSWSENAAPYGSGENWPMPMSDICDHCISNGKCPRCGQTTMNGNDDGDVPTICSVCGWDERATGHPEGFECCCWMADEPDYF